MSRLKVIEGELQKLEDEIVLAVIKGRLTMARFRQAIKMLDRKSGHLSIVKIDTKSGTFK